MLKETNNVCNMPEIMNLSLHQSADTGRYYITFIQYDREPKGRWLNKHVTEEEAKRLVDFAFNPKKSCLNCAHYDVCIHINKSDNYAKAETCNEFLDDSILED